MSKNPERILIIRLSSIGDIVLTSPVIRVLRKKYPNAFLAMLVKKEFSLLVKDCPYLDEVIIFDKNEELSVLKDKIKSKKFDLVIDLHCNLRSLIIDYTCGIKRRLIYRKRILKRWFLMNLRVNLFPANVSVIDYYFEPFKALNIEDDGKGLELWINQEDDKKAGEFLKDNIQDKKKLIGIAPFAHWETKCWPLENYYHLIKSISKKIDCQFIVFGGPEDERRLKDFNNMEVNPIIAIGKLSLMAQAALIKKCNYFIGNDTGLMHIADAANIPLITFFGPTVPEFGFAPVGTNAVVLSRDLKCRPCSLHGSSNCPKGAMECLASITPEEVSNMVIKHFSG